MACCGKMKFLVYDEKIVVKYEAYPNSNDNCDIELELYHPFNRHRAILSDINIDDVDNAVLDYMSLQFYCDTEACNKLQAYEVVEYFKSQINK